MPRYLVTETVEYLVDAENADKAIGLVFDHDIAPGDTVHAMDGVVMRIEGLNHTAQLVETEPEDPS